MHRRHTKQIGFTLIELLVVVAIIGMLFAMMLPSLAVARRKAEGLKCTSISRGAGLIMINYLSDNKAFFPPLTTAPADGSPAIWGYYYGSWYSFLRPWINLGNPNGNGTYRSDDAKLICCPSKVSGTWTYGYPYFSYAMPWSLRHRVSGNPLTSWRLEELRKHNETGMFVDGGTYADALYWMAVPLYSQTERIAAGSLIYSAQHESRGFSATYLDGHSNFTQVTPEENASYASAYGSNINITHATFFGLGPNWAGPSANGYLENHGKYTP